MDQLFRMPIKGILNIRAKDQQINHQPTLKTEHFDINFCYVSTSLLVVLSRSLV